MQPSGEKQCQNGSQPGIYVEVNRFCLVGILRDADVLFGRGKGVSSHPGNMAMLRKVEEMTKEYELHLHGGKKLVVEEVLRGIQSRNGRFLKRFNDSHWIEVSHEEAMLKIYRAFRSWKYSKPKLEGRPMNYGISKAPASIASCPDTKIPSQGSATRASLGADRKYHVSPGDSYPRRPLEDRPFESVPRKTEKDSVQAFSPMICFASSAGSLAQSQSGASSDKSMTEATFSERFASATSNDDDLLADIERFVNKPLTEFSAIEHTSSEAEATFEDKLEDIGLLRADASQDLMTAADILKGIGEWN